MSVDTIMCFIVSKVTGGRAGACEYVECVRERECKVNLVKKNALDVQALPFRHVACCPLCGCT
jgi:hypothetical protein